MKNNKDLEKKLILRPATENDCRFVWELRNHPISRKYSKNTKEIPFEHHIKWFNSTIFGKERKIFIAMLEGDDVGTIRFDFIKENPKAAEVSIVIIPEKQNMKFGTALLKKASKFALNEFGLDRIIARIKWENTASIKAFTNAGYIIVEKNDFWKLEFKN